MKYFNPSYWFKLWLLSAPLFNDKTQGINAKSIDNKKIKDWASKDITSLESINEASNLTNSSNNYQSYNLNQVLNQNINPIYQTELETSTHKHRHEKSRSKRQNRNINNIITSYLVIRDTSNPVGENYLTSLGDIVQRLINNRIILQLSGEPNVLIHRYGINPEMNNDQNFFRIPINIHHNNIPLELVLRSRDLYFQGFILNNNRYYHFNDSTINSVNIDTITNRRLSISSRYVSTNLNINWDRILQAFNFLTTFNDNNYTNYQRQQNLIENMMVVAFATSESLRFQTIANMINNLENNSELSYNWNDNIFPIVRSWDTSSANIFMRDIPTLPNNNPQERYFSDVRISTNRITQFCINQNLSTSRRIRSSDIYCNLIGNFYEENCIFERVSNALSSSNSIKLKLTYTMWNKIEILKELCNDIQDFKNKLKKIINNFPQNNQSTARNEDDKNAMVEIIIEHYDEIKNKFSFRKDYPTSKFLVIQGGTDKWFGGAVFHDANNRKDMHIHDQLKRKKRNYTISEDKWNDDFTKSINHEQHLPIDNKTNFIASNITSF